MPGLFWEAEVLGNQGAQWSLRLAQGMGHGHLWRLHSAVPDQEGLGRAEPGDEGVALGEAVTVLLLLKLRSMGEAGGRRFEDMSREFIAAILLIAVSLACFGTFLTMQLMGESFNTYEPSNTIRLLEIIVSGLVGVFAIWNLIKVVK